MRTTTSLFALLALAACDPPEAVEPPAEGIAVALTTDETRNCGPVSAEHANRVVYTPLYGVEVRTMGFDVVAHADPACRLDVNSIDRGITRAVDRWVSRGYSRDAVLGVLARLTRVQMLEGIPQPDAAARTVITWSGSPDNFAYVVEIPLNPYLYGGAPYPVFCTTFLHELDHAFSYGLRRSNYAQVGHTTDIDGVPRSSEELAGGVPPYGTWCGEPAPQPPSSHVAVQWGVAGDLPLTADLTGAGRDSLVVFRESDGVVYAVDAVSGEMRFLSWGLPGDRPLAADFLGVGHDQLAQWRPSDGTWYLMDVPSSGIHVAQWGQAGDVPFAGDLRGTGRSDLAIYRPGTGAVWVRDAVSGEHLSRQLGTASDVPLAGDYLGQGRDQVALYDAGSWRVHDLVTGESRAFSWGLPGDVPLTGRFIDPARTSLAVFRPSEGVLYAMDAVDGRIVTLHWGAAGDVPLAGQFLESGRESFAQWRPSTGTWWIWR